MAPKKFFFNFSPCRVCDIISTELVVIAFYFSVKMSSVTESAQIYSLLIQQHYKVSFHIRAVVFMPSSSNRCNYQMEGNNPSYCAKWYWRGGVRKWEGGGKSSHRGWLVQVPQIMPGFIEGIEGTLLIPPLLGGMLCWPKGPPCAFLCNDVFLDGSQIPMYTCKWRVEL